MPYTFACGDVVPGCTTQFVGATKEDILVQVTGHARVDHDLPEVPDEVAAAVLAAIRET
jgi:predicted small metal-binding protein